MEVKRNDVGKNKIRIDVTIPAEELVTYVETAYQFIADSSGIELAPGEDARPKVVEMLGEADASSMVDNLVMNAAAPLAVHRLRVDTLTSPQVGSEEHAELGKDFAFTCVIYTKPEVSLTSYDPVEVAVPDYVPVTPEEVENQIEYMVMTTATVDENGVKVLPALTDSWVREHFDDCESVPQLRERVRLTMNAQRRQQRDDILRYGCANQLVARLVCDLPEEAIKLIQAETRRGFEAELLRQGQSKKELCASSGLTEEQFDKINDSQVLGTIQRGLALDALANHLDIKVTDEDYFRYFHQIEPGREEQLEEDYRDAGRIDGVRESIRRTIATDWLVENATITKA